MTIEPIHPTDLVRRLRERGASVATAESCTGGLIGHLITEVPGSSAVFAGGVIAYTDRFKTGGLGVAADLIKTHGAVSEAVARAMAKGARERLGSTFSLAVTGVAGPGGGTADKPVGLVYVACAGPAGTRVDRCIWDSDRSGNKRLSAEHALALLAAQLKDHAPPA
ncbi:MAG: CinA family protein [Opitutales bacterium]